MAQKRQSSAADQQQPSPSSSSDQDDHEDEEVEDSSSSEDEEEPPPAPAPAPAPNKKPTPKKPPPPPSTKSQPPPSPSNSATDSGSESDDPPATANPKPKPLEESPKPKKPRAQPSATAARSASKRASENNQHVANEAKKAKKKVSDAGAGEGEIPVTEEGAGGGAKKLIWSEEDEIAILKGLAEFTCKTGGDPYKDANAFHEFVKKKLRAKASSNQLKEKIRRLKKKFANNAGKGKNGEGPRFTKLHEEKAFELSKKVWPNGGVEHEKSNAKPKKNQKEGSSSSKDVGSAKPQAVDPAQQNLMEAEQKGIEENGDSIEMFWIDNFPGVSGANEEVLKRGVQLIGASKRAELKERWKKLQVAELELYVNRAELIKDQTKLICEAYKSANH